MASSKDGWENPEVAQKYAIAERGSGPFARLLIEQAGLQTPSGSPPVVFDSACGTGAVAAQLYDLLSSQDETRGNMKVTCGDTSEPMILYLRNRAKKEGWTGTEAELIDGVDTKLPSATYTHAFSTFGVAHMADPLAALAEMHRVLVPGGSIGLAFWHEIDWYKEHVRAALETLPGPPKNPTADEFLKAITKGVWNDPKWTEEKLVAAGFEDVKSAVQKKTVYCGTPAQFATMVYMPLTLIANVFWTEEDRERCQHLAVSVVEKHMADLFGEDGEVECPSQAVIATGRKK